jgi:hypothetical protein
VVADDPVKGELLDAVKELERSPGWRLVAERITHELERSRTALEQPTGPEMTATLRGGIGALRMVLNIPGILKDEFKE